MLRAVVLCALVALAASVTIEREEEVIVGTNENFDTVISSNEFALVEFYAPWCGHCKSLAPEYAKAAKTLAAEKSPIVLVKVDATVQDKPGEKFSIRGYPTLYFFRNGKHQEYNGGRTANDIVLWLKKKSGPAATTLASSDAVTAFADANDVAVVGFFASESSTEAVQFLVAAGAGELPFGIVTDAAVAAAQNAKVPSVAVFKKFDDGRVNLEADIDAKTVTDFVGDNTLPLLVEFSDKTAPKIFGGSVKTHVLVFAKDGVSGLDSIKESARVAAGGFKGKVIFVYLDAGRDDNQRVLEYFGVKDGMLPTVRLISLADEMAKYKPTSNEITSDVLAGFVNDFFAGNLKRHLQSEATPADWDSKPVKVLTGDNFASVALDSSKNVFVEFYAPWCGHCKQLVPIWDKLAETFAAHPNVVIAKMDSTANEVEGIKVESFPTIKFFPAGDKSKVVDFEGSRTLEGFSTFLTEQTGAAVEVPVEAAGEDDDSHDEL